MMKPTQICHDDSQRRRDVRAHTDAEGKPDLNGIDYIEVDEHDHHILYVHFMDKAPENITEKHIRIEGGRRIRDIKAGEPVLCDPADPEQADCMRVTVDRVGDFSTYTLCLVALDDQGHPTDKPLEGFDARYACADFSFKANCPSDLDCPPKEICSPQRLPEPDINYLAKDYASFRQLILDRLALTMPDWKERHVPDIGLTLVEILAYVGDYLSYYQDAVATEAYLGTARQRISVRRHARLVDYVMHEGCNARTWLFVETSDDIALDPRDTYFIARSNGALFGSSPMLSGDDLRGISLNEYEVFEPLLAKPEQFIQLYQAHNEISFYTWGEKECCLPRGTTSATLDASGQLHLKVGDVLIFEEVLGSKTGDPADADPAHRHAVRLTRVEEGMDDLYKILVVEIEWGAEDALPFPLCLSAIGPAPDCQLLTNICIAHGNIILVDNGQTVEDSPVKDGDLESVPAEATLPRCEGEDNPAEPELKPGLFRPRLQQAPLTFYEPLPGDAPFTSISVPDPRKPVSLTPASRLLLQDPRRAFPWISLLGTPPDDGGTLYRPGSSTDTDSDDIEEEEGSEQSTRQAIRWYAQQDLLASASQDNHFVVEMDNDGLAHLRFGDGSLGRMPDPGTTFRASYRIGNGQRGKVGAETISYIVSRKTRYTGLLLQPRNPFAVHVGTDPEPLSEVRLFAPHAFRTDLQRAITADDYARLAERNPKVQRAAATLRWTGSWYEVLVAIDPRGAEEASQVLLDEITASLENYRRIGHDLKVVVARYVPLDIALKICVQPHFLRGHVKAALLDLFSNRVLSNGRLGFFHPDNLTFGTGIALSKLVATAAAVPGVQSVMVTRLQRLFEGPNHELDNEFLAIGLDEIVQLDNDPNFPEHGQLTITMEGGR